MLVLNVFSIHEVSVKKTNIIIFIANKTLAGKAIQYNTTLQTGADPGFQVRGGALKEIAPSGGRRENCLGISCEKSRFYAKKSYFFQLRREARKCLGYFV
jgi:hypothetical protein